VPNGVPIADNGYYEGRFSNGLSFADLITNKYVGVLAKTIFPFGFRAP
jgi:hypothetical protein